MPDKILEPWERYGDHEARYWKPMKGRQLRFIDEYLIDLDASQAARRAGYRAYYEAGKALLEDWRVKQAVKERIEARAERCQINADRVLMEIQFAAFFDPLTAATVQIKRERKTADDDGNIKIEEYMQRGIRTAEDIEHLPPDIRRCITGWKYDRYGNLQLTFMDKTKALELLAKHLGLLTERVEVTVTDHASAMDAAKRRALQAREMGLNTASEKREMN